MINYRHISRRREGSARSFAIAAAILLAIGSGAFAASGNDTGSARRPPAIVQPLGSKAATIKEPARVADPKAATPQADNPQAQLKTARAELAGLKRRYTDLHPDVIAKKRHIKLLEGKINATGK